MNEQKQKRKEIAKNYVQTHRPMGIYQIKNKVNGKLLIGSSMDLNGMFNRHQFFLQMGGHSNKELEREWKEFGGDSFLFEILEQIKPREEVLQSFDELKKYKIELEEMEQMWLEELQPYGDRGYHKKTLDIGQSAG
ncbi:GIY-YIG nuclease family protein [Paenibacillus sp. LMG 31456]|uniref:GIY-YIG nuclease family protein n=1 Tax=Paenibacillus foliorum TaxID=2654974 RepID=A0A972K387_9BACL|nr:GIY-YIG nuclease family protein [Paenibacillus foliorum]NOU96730.1 GIY-YIG nuclease family protein [Paenibacillus foliorum]